MSRSAHGNRVGFERSSLRWERTWPTTIPYPRETPTVVYVFPASSDRFRGRWGPIRRPLRSVNWGTRRIPDYHPSKSPAIMQRQNLNGYDIPITVADEYVELVGRAEPVKPSRRKGPLFDVPH